MTKQEIINYMYENHVQGDFKIEEMAEDLAQPERKTGEWIVKTDGFVIKRVWGVCSKCGNTLDFGGVNAGRGDANFCPSCGADMRGEQHE